MSNQFDDLVNSWIISKFMEGDGRQQQYGNNNAYKYNYETDGSFNDITVTSADMGWDCGCYSSWTRDDTFEVTALLKTKGREVQFVYGTWLEFPDFIQELDEYKNLSDFCSVEGRNDEW